MSSSWVLGLFIGTLGIISHFTYIRFASEYNFWLLAIGFFMVCVSSNNRY